MSFDYAAWRAAHRDQLRAYNRAWMARRRSDPVYRAAEQTRKRAARAARRAG